MKQEKSLSEQFCHDLLELGINRSKAIANLVMALSSYQKADSLVELSLSPLFQHQFSSIFKCIHDLASDEESYEKRAKQILSHCLCYAAAQKRVRLQTDVTPLIKEYSPTLEGRQYVKKSNNVISKNQPITVGLPLSCVNISGEEKWSLPLVRQRVPVSHTESSFAVLQVKSILPELKKALGCDLVINTTDTAYTHPSYLSPLYEEENLVCISRFRHGCKVYTSVPQQESTKGTPKIYGDCFYLLNTNRIVKGIVPKTGKSYEKEQISIHHLACDEQLVLDAVTSKGTALKIQLYRWNDLKIRTKKGHCMKHKPFDLIGCRVIHAATGAVVFKRDMFFGVFGKAKAQVSTEEAYTDYRHRYDCEPSFRFNKQELFLDSYACEDIQHLDNFLLVNQLANWLLYVAAGEVNFIPRKWEHNKSKPTQAVTKQTMAKTRRSTEELFLTFDLSPFVPKPSKKGKGRKKEARVHYKVVKKTQKRA